MATRKHNANIDLIGNQLINSVLQNVAGDHGTALEGIIWWDSAAKQVAYFDGTVVRRVPLSTGGADASSLQGHDGAYYLSRSNHTGTQLASTISDFSQAVNALLATYATQSYVQQQITALVDSSPAALDTLKELADALGDDPNFAATINAQIALRAKTFAATVGDGAATSIAVNHNLNTTDVIVQTRDVAAPGRIFDTEVQVTDANNITLLFSPNAPPLNSVRVMVQGR